MKQSKSKRLAATSIVGALSLLAIGCAIPARYNVSLPKDVADGIPLDGFSDAEELLVLPCWRWVKEPGYSFGPPAVVPRTSLESLAEAIEEQKGLDIIRPFGHPPSEAPIACGVVIIGDNGFAYRARYSLEWSREDSDAGSFEWTQLQTAQATGQIRRALLTALGGDRPSDEDASLALGRAPAWVFGDADEIEGARTFLEALPLLAGGGVWHPLENQ